MLERGWSEQVVLDVWAIFRDYWLNGKGKNTKREDWSATWRNWFRKENIKPQGGNHETDRSSDYWMRHCVGGVEHPSDLGQPIGILLPCVESSHSGGGAGCPHGECCAIEWICRSGESGDTGGGQH